MTTPEHPARTAPRPIDADAAQVPALCDEDDRSLIAAVLEGRDGALEILIRRLQPALLRTARAIVDESRAEDVTQEAWINILRSLPEFRWNAALKTWAIRITLNQAFSLRRHDRRQQEREAPLPDLFDARGHWRERVEPWHADTPEALLASEQLSQAIQSGLSALPETQRLALLLRDIEGLEMTAVCNILDVSASNVRVLLHRGRAKLREVIDAFQSGR